jgi:hypothetical protein
LLLAGARVLVSGGVEEGGHVGTRPARESTLDAASKRKVAFMDGYV